ncbi:hypothetical protein LCGC14_0960470, partial [marine sediment metagenome]
EHGWDIAYVLKMITSDKPELFRDHAELIAACPTMHERLEKAEKLLEEIAEYTKDAYSGPGKFPTLSVSIYKKLAKYRSKSDE